MADAVIKRIGIIPRKEPQSGDDIRKVLERLEQYKKAIPNTMLSVTNYKGVIQGAINRQRDYDIIIAFRLSDGSARTSYNICIAAYEMERRRISTLLLLPFNHAYEEGVELDRQDRIRKGETIDEKVEETLEWKLSLFNTLTGYENDPHKPNIGYVVVTSGRELPFVFNVVRDMIGGPNEYREKMKDKRILKIESQKDFLNFPPDYTEMGLPRP